MSACEEVIRNALERERVKKRQKKDTEKMTQKGKIERAETVREKSNREREKEI